MIPWMFWMTGCGGCPAAVQFFIVTVALQGCDP